MPNVGYATLQVIPSMRGIEGALTNLLDGPAGDAGRSAGSAFGEKFATGLKVAGAAGGALLAAGVLGGMNVEAANDKLAAQLNLSGPAAALAGQRAGELYRGAFVEDVEAGGAIVRAVAQNIGTDLNSADFSGIAAKVADLTTAFDEDLGTTTAAVGQLMRNGLAPDATAALDIITAGLQGPANMAGDVLDTFNEYPALFARLGLDGGTALGLINQGMAAGARNSDLVADALKEFQIRATDGSTTSAEGFKALGLNAEAATAQIAAGGAGASQGLADVLAGLRNMEDPVARNAAATALFGTQAEDLGAALFALDPTTAVSGLGELAGRTEALGKTLNDNASTNLKTFWNSAQATFVDLLGGRVLPVVNDVAAGLATGLGPAVTATGAFLTGTLVPGLSSAASWLETNRTTIGVLATVLGVVLLPVFASVTVAAVSSGASQVAAWAASRAAAVSSSAASVAAHYRNVAGWIASAGAAVSSGATTVAIWALYKIEAAQAAAVWVASNARIAASQVAQTAALVASRAVMIAGAAATGIVTAAQWAWNAALTANPIGIVVVAIAALVAALVFAWQNSETFRNVVTGAWEGIKTAASAVGSWFTQTIPAWWSGILSDARAKWDGVVAVFHNVRAQVSAAVQTVLDVVMRVFSYTPIGFVISNFDAIVGFFRGIPDKIRGALDAAPEMLRRAGSSIIQGLADGITAGLGKVTDAVRNVLAKARDLLPFSPAKTGPFSGKGWTLYSGRSISTALAAGMLDELGAVASAGRRVVDAAALSFPAASPGELLAYRAPAPIEGGFDDEAAARRRRRGGGGDNPGGITINGNVGWTLDEVERQRRTRNRRRATVRGIATVAAGRA